MKTTSLAFITFLGAASVAFSACAKDARTDAVPDRSQHTSAMTGHEQVVELSVTADGFVPASFKVHAGHPVKLVVTRKVERTCATDIVIKDLKISAPLPLNKAVELTFTPTKPGKVRFACAMEMIAGEIVVE
jgi:plastocyanin domain-containing protein